jgi:hypothetical protein
MMSFRSDLIRRLALLVVCTAFAAGHLAPIANAVSSGLSSIQTCLCFTTAMIPVMRAAPVMQPARAPGPDLVHFHSATGVWRVIGSERPCICDA